MTSATKSPTGIKIQSVAYENFMGLDVSRDRTSLDTGKNQHLSVCQDAFCDWRGQVTRDPGCNYLVGSSPVVAVNFYSKDKVVFAEQDGSAINLISEDGHEKQAAFPLNSVVTSSVFNRRNHFFSRGEPPLFYDGTNYNFNQSPALDQLRPAFSASVSRRLCVAGISGSETNVAISRVDNDEIFPDDEPIDSVSVLRAGNIDISNQLGTSESITGLAKFEQSRLAVFTTDRTLIFLVDVDIGLWALDDKASINVGCISHQTIKSAGTDLLFCSRSGVHSLRRSAENGITIEGESLSSKIDTLYRSLVRSVEDPEKISAVYDQDMGQYHIFFPQSGGVITKRLTMTIFPGMDPKWSTGTFLNARCGAALGGRLVFGSSGGIYDIKKIEEEAEVHPDMVLKTPVLWHGSFTDTKSIHSILIQATGNGTATLEVTDDMEQLIHSDTFEISDSGDDNNYPDVPLSRQYERKFEGRYRGAQYKLTVSGKGICRIIGFGVILRKS
tara:strand:- start:4052 stop:5548 length:1497 start_codon:yes stop_codon:yes gene_type:complete